MEYLAQYINLNYFLRSNFGIENKQILEINVLEGMVNY